LAASLPGFWVKKEYCSEEALLRKEKEEEKLGHGRVVSSLRSEHVCEETTGWIWEKEEVEVFLLAVI